jgi:ABC-2 type transport system ATP-binding protein
MGIIIESEGLSRRYQSYIKPEGVWASVQGFFNRQYEERIALQPTDLSLEHGQIVGLVGSNGAGKTTLLKLLSGLIYPSSGTAKVLGFEPWKREAKFLKRISLLLGQKNQLWWDLPAADSYDLLMTIYELDRVSARKRVKMLSELLDCAHLLHIQLRRLSLGERMKMEIIGALLHEPEVLFLDEPTIGLDIVAQTKIREFLAEYVKMKNPTIILTSHYMDDISRLAKRLLLISQGQIVYDGSLQAFVRKVDTRQKILIATEKPLERKIIFNGTMEVPAGESLISLELAPQEVGRLLPLVLEQSPIREIKTEDLDFEDVIRRFLEKDHRVGTTRSTQPV